MDGGSKKDIIINDYLINKKVICGIKEKVGKIFPNFEITIADKGIYIYLVWLKLSIGLFIKIVF